MNLLTIRARQIRPLVNRLPRVAPWLPAGVVAVTALAVAARAPSAADGALWRLRGSGVAMAAALAFVLDDQAALTLAASPTPLASRRGVRIGAAVALAAIWWSGLLAVFSVRVHGPLPWAAPTLEFAMYAAIGLAASVWASRWSDDGFGGIAGALTAMAAFASTLIPMPRWWPFVALSNPGANTRFALLLATAIALFCAGTLDPASRRYRWRQPPWP